MTHLGQDSRVCTPDDGTLLVHFLFSAAMSDDEDMGSGSDEECLFRCDYSRRFFVVKLSVFPKSS